MAPFERSQCLRVTHQLGSRTSRHASPGSSAAQSQGLASGGGLLHPPSEIALPPYWVDRSVLLSKTPAQFAQKDKVTHFWTFLHLGKQNVRDLQGGQRCGPPPAQGLSNTCNGDYCRRRGELAKRKHRSIALYFLRIADSFTPGMCPTLFPRLFFPDICSGRESPQGLEAN